MEEEAHGKASNMSGMMEKYPGGRYGCSGVSTEEATDEVREFRSSKTSPAFGSTVDFNLCEVLRPLEGFKEETNMI